MPVGAAIVGSAAIGGIASSSAANKAAKTSQAANDAATQLQQQQFNQTRADNEPFRQFGLAGLGEIARAYGLNGQGGAPAAANDDRSRYQAYLQEWPDVAQAWDQVKGDPKYGGDILNWAKSHFETYGQQDGRQLPSAPAQQPGTPQVQTPGGSYSLTANADGTVSGNRPAIGAAPTFERPATQPFSYADRAQSTPFQYADRQAAQPFSFAPRQQAAPLDVSLGAFQNSGEYAASQNAYDRIADGTNAQFSATGALQSGAAAKALQDRAQANAVQYYGQFRGAESNQYNVNNARADQNYNQDYANAFGNYQYGTNRQDQNYNTDRATALAGYQFDANRTDQNYGQDYGNAQANYQYGTSLNANNFASDRATGLSQYNTNTALTQDLYNQDRQNLVNQGQQRFNNLFNLAGYGQNANSSNAAAGSAYANNASQGLLSSAAATNNANLTGAANFNNMLGAGVNAFAYTQGNKPAAQRSTLYGPSGY